jgi:hypothetical protein
MEEQVLRVKPQQVVHFLKEKKVERKNKQQKERA